MAIILNILKDSDSAWCLHGTLKSIGQQGTSKLWAGIAHFAGKMVSLGPKIEIYLTYIFLL